MRESFLVFCAFVILSIIALSIHSKTLDSTELSLQNEARLSALASAQELMDEVANRSFDEQTVEQSIDSTSDLTSFYKFGVDIGDTFKDDVDDYQGYTIAGDSTLFPGSILGVTVSYVNPHDPHENSKTPSFLKRITVTVENTEGYMEEAISFSTIVSYY